MARQTEPPHQARPEPEVESGAAGGTVVRIQKASRSSQLDSLAKDDSRRFVDTQRRQSTDSRRESGNSFSSMDEYFPTTQYINVGTPQPPAKLSEVSYTAMSTFRDALKAARLGCPR